MLHTDSQFLQHWEQWGLKREKTEGEKMEALVTFVSPSDGFVVWVASLEKFSCHRMIRQTETLDAGREKEKNGGVSQ